MNTLCGKAKCIQPALLKKAIIVDASLRVITKVVFDSAHRKPLSSILYNDASHSPPPRPLLTSVVDPDPKILESWIRIRIKVKDPDPHPNLNQSEKVQALEGHFGALEGPKLGKCKL